MSNLAALTPRDEVKFVLGDRADYEFARDFTREHGLERQNRQRIVFTGIPERAEPRA